MATGTTAADLTTALGRLNDIKTRTGTYIETLKQERRTCEAEKAAAAAALTQQEAALRAAQDTSARSAARLRVVETEIERLRDDARTHDMQMRAILQALTLHNAEMAVILPPEAGGGGGDGR